MNSNLEVLDKIVDCSNGKGYFHNINALLIKGKFTDKEKVAAEKFLFDPSKTNAIKALNVTPKSYVFLKNYMDEGEVISEIVNVIDNREYNYAYIKALITNPELGDIADKLRQTSVANKIDNIIKRCHMVKKLHR